MKLLIKPKYQKAVNIFYLRLVALQNSKSNNGWDRHIEKTFTINCLV
tara:strand:+ start:1059 stop:1199 length:141 start_codon:yes stop_codon:yes gene_type:complete